MNIAIDGTSLLLPSAGVKNHLYYWLVSLFKAAPLLGDRISVYPAGVPLPPVLNHEKSVAGAFGTAARLALVHFANIRKNPARDLLLIRKDLFHCSQHTSSIPRRVVSTATVFDLSCWTTPDSHTPENIAATRRYAEKILKRCDAVMAISEHARNDAIEILRIPPERIGVIYPGVPDAFFSVSAADAEAARHKYGLARTYILFVGCIEPRKNVAGLIRAYDRLPGSVQRDAQLVIAGPLGWKTEGIRDLLYDNRRSLRYLGYVPEQDLPGLIRGAAMLVYPSYYEGFGLPVAQAMAAGVPVVTSDRASLPEVVGDAGLTIDPDWHEQLSAAIERVLTSPDLARDLGRRAKARAERFQLPASAFQSLQFFHNVAGARALPERQRPLSGAEHQTDGD